MSLLARIAGPDDLRHLSLAELEELAREIREEIVAVVSRNGGHLAANLGVVELTLALHRVFRSPQDRIVWDTGHQTYAHKLVTGRRDAFGTLRQAGGLAGFCKRRESPHDVWEAGHAGTGISAALGFALARDRLGESYRVVAVVGDGALTCGHSFEALNNAGQAGSDLIVVLNDNSMSISPNVGAIARHLGRLRSDPAYRRVKEDLGRLVERIPGLGPSVARTAERLKDGLKQLLLPGMFFEELGFTYLGPADGHDLRETLEVLRQATRLKGPVLVHVVTRKGKGYAPAERSPAGFHSVGRFDAATGETAGAAAPTFTEAFRRALLEEAACRPEVVAVTAAMPEGTGLDAFARAHPERFYDVGIAEGHAVIFAAGLASAGLRPVVAIYSTFLQRAYDQVLHDVCLQSLPVTFALDRAGVVGPDGETHQGLYDLAYLRSLPGLAVAAPRDELVLADVLHTALEQRGPVAFRYPKAAARGLPRRLPQRLSVGRGELLRPGRDVAVLAVGPLVYAALDAAAALAEHGVEVAVADPVWVAPLDEELVVRLVRGCRAVVTVEEGVLAGGFGSAVLEVLAGRGLPRPVRRLGFADGRVPPADRGAILAGHGLDAAGIARACREVLAGTARPGAETAGSGPAGGGAAPADLGAARAGGAGRRAARGGR